MGPDGGGGGDGDGVEGEDGKGKAGKKRSKSSSSSKTKEKKPGADARKEQERRRKRELRRGRSNRVTPLLEDLLTADNSRVRLVDGKVCDRLTEAHTAAEVDLRQLKGRHDLWGPTGHTECFASLVPLPADTWPTRWLQRLTLRRECTHLPMRMMPRSRVVHHGRRAAYSSIERGPGQCKCSTRSCQCCKGSKLL